MFWTVPPTIPSGARMAGTIALISGFGNLGGFLGPYLMGVIETATGSGASGLYAVALIVAAGAVIVTTCRWVGLKPPKTSKDSKNSQGSQEEPPEERETDDAHRALR